MRSASLGRVAVVAAIATAAWTSSGPAAVVEWTVDLTPPPAPLIDERPAQVTTAKSARFAFHDEEAGAAFRCGLDGGDPAACQSPVEYAALADDEHAFTVLAVDAAGNASEPVQVEWMVVPVQATLGDGAWSWFGDPRAVRFNGVHRRTYVGWSAGGEAAGAVAADETGAHPGAYAAQGATLSQPGAIAGDPDTAAGFDGLTGEMSAATASLSAQGTLEGWFDWRAGTALMRDSTTAGGWILIYDSGDAGRTMRTRIAGATFTTDLPSPSFQDGWHHFAVTKDGSDVRLYVDAKRLPLRLTSAGTPAPSTGAWHVMRNGRSTTNAYTQGRADEIAVYGTALTLGDIQRHYELGRG